MYKIPLFDLNYDEREQEAVAATLDSKWISSGPKCMELEDKFGQALGSPYAYATANCTAALHLALCALGIGPEDEVIVPSLTFVATVNAIKYVNAEPVFCDIVSPDNLTISPEEIEKLITQKTRAVIVMHYGGYACNMEKIMALSEKYGLYVIEDACHGPLSEYQGKKLGTIGDVGCFSFFSNKNMSTGEGGMIVTRHKETGERIKLLRSHGMTSMSYERAKGHSTVYDVVDLGYNYRMDDIRASLGIVQLEKLQPDLEERMKVRRLYEEYLKGCERIIIPFAGYAEFSSNYIMPVVLKDSNSEERDNVRQFLQEKGIQTSVHYPAAHRFSIYENAKKGSLINTEYTADCELTLPMYARLSQKEIVYICDSLKKAVEG